MLLLRPRERKRCTFGFVGCVLGVARYRHEADDQTYGLLTLGFTSERAGAP